MTGTNNEDAAVVGAPRTARDAMEELRGHPAYELAGKDWASTCAGVLVDMVSAYAEDVLAGPGELPKAENFMDPAEEYVRACAAASPAVSMALMLPAAYAYAGAAHQGSLWCSWNGRRTWQVAPATVMALGTAPSGAGKSTQQKLLDLPLNPALEEGEGAVMRWVTDWAVRAHAAVDEVMAAVAAELDAQPDPDKSDEFRKAKKAAHKLIDQVDAQVSAGLVTIYSDATAEALVSTAAEFGGSAFIKSAEQDMLDNLTRYQVGGSASLSLFTDGWDGAAYRRARKGSGVESTSALVVSMSLLTQTEAFTKAFIGSAGANWLDKGLLGRAWVQRSTRGSLESGVAADAGLRAGAGLGESVDFSGLERAWSRMSVLGAGARAARLLEGRLARAAAGAGVEASLYLKRALAAAGGAWVLPRAMTLSSVAAADGLVGGCEGVVLRVAAADARRLEDLFTWLARVQEYVLLPDPVLNPVLSRWTYHVVRLAGLRETMARAAQHGDGAWEAWVKAVVEGKAELDSGVLADTAVRLAPWLLHQHLGALGSLVGGMHMESARDLLERSRGRDLSMGGQIAEAMRAAGVVSGFPMSVTTLVDKIARGNQAREFRSGIRSYFREQYDLQKQGLRGDGLFQLKQGRVKDSVIIMGFGDETAVIPTPAGMKAVLGVAAPGGVKSG